MKLSFVQKLAFTSLVAVGVVQGVDAQVLPDSNAVVAQPGTATALPAPSQAPQGQADALTADEAKQSVAGNVAELQQMTRGSDLTELRSTQNGSYGASLLYYAKEMTYYVALFQQKHFWRVIKTQDEARADLIYGDFARQTVQLSDVEIRRTRLEAQKAITEQMITLSQDRANRLQADLEVAHEQQKIVADQQQQTRAEAAALAQQKAAAQDQLRLAQRQVRELQRQLDSGLTEAH